MPHTRNDRPGGWALNNTGDSRQARSALLGWSAVLGIGLVAFGVIGQTLWSAQQTAAWTPVPARVTRSGPVLIGKRSSALELHYEYVFGGHVMIGENI